MMMMYFGDETNLNDREIQKVKTFYHNLFLIITEGSVNKVRISYEVVEIKAKIDV